MKTFGKFLAVTIAFVISPMAPVFVHMFYELMHSGNLDHLDPMIFICTFLGYVAMIVVAWPMYLCVGDKVPELKPVLVFGATIGAFTAVLLSGFVLGFVSFDEAWLSDMVDFFYFIINGMIFGLLSALCFWVFAYSWRSESSSK